MVRRRAVLSDRVSIKIYRELAIVNRFGLVLCSCWITLLVFLFSCISVTWLRFVSAYVNFTFVKILIVLLVFVSVGYGLTVLYRTGITRKRD